MNFDPKAVAEQIRDLVAKANRVGVAVETAIDAFIDQLWPTMRAANPGELTPFASCPPELQADILDAAEACKTAE